MHNPYNYHVAVRDDAMFFGRQELIAHLISGLGAPTPISTAIFGGRRCGKTSLLSKLTRTMQANPPAAGGRRLVPCHLDLQRGRPLANSQDFFLWVLEELGEWQEQQRKLERGLIVETLQRCYRDSVARGPADAFVRAFGLFDTYLNGERIRLVIMTDESEELHTVAWGEDLRPNLRYLLSQSPIAPEVALVMAGSTLMYTKVTEHGSPLENVLDRQVLPALSYPATLALARQPNQNRLPQTAAEEVWCQSGGQPCMAQYLLHELWDDLDGELQDASPQLVQEVAGAFDERTHHLSSWAETLGEAGSALYRFMAERYQPLTLATIRQQFPDWVYGQVKGTIEALVYHGLIRSEGNGIRREYVIAGRMYRDWFLTAGKLHAPKHEPLPGGKEGGGTQIYIQGDIEGDVVMGNHHTGVDQRRQKVSGPQTNLAGDPSGGQAGGQHARSQADENEAQ